MSVADRSPDVLGVSEFGAGFDAASSAARAADEAAERGERESASAKAQA
jgi:hypothetical protein